MKRARERALWKKKDNYGRETPDVGDTGVTKTISSSSARAAKTKNAQKITIDKYTADKDLKVLNRSVFVFVNEANGIAPYKTENRSATERIYFRQRSCEIHAWDSLAPGEGM